MIITDVEYGADGGYHATVDGRDLFLAGGEVPAAAGQRCDLCGQGEDDETAIYMDTDGQVALCNYCLGTPR